jgi:hypothetical protein
MINDFFATLYQYLTDLLCQNLDFTPQLYDNFIFEEIGVKMVSFSLIWMFIYYYGVSNYGNLYSLKKWLVWVLIICIINFMVCYYFTEYDIYLIFKPQESPFTFWSEYFPFAVVNVFWTIIFCFAFSLVLKIKSTRASKTPF